MLSPQDTLAIFMEGNATGPPAKMGHGVIRYSQNRIACVIDSNFAGSDMAAVADLDQAIPIVESVQDAISGGANVLVLGIAPGGGVIPGEWYASIDEAVRSGMSVVNGLHDLLAPRYADLAVGQWIWDVRTEPSGLITGSGRAAKLNNRRLLMIGTDMAVGKMTAGLEIYRAAIGRGLNAQFVATGQIGITITGRGVPLDAIRLDFAAGAIEREVLAAGESDVTIVEGQGSLVHPASSANLPLLRGSCPTHMILCHREGQEALYRMPRVTIPPLKGIIRLYEDVAEACGTFARPRTVGVALNTFHLKSTEAADEACRRIEDDLRIVCVDPVRHGAERLLSTIVDR